MALRGTTLALHQNLLLSRKRVKFDQRFRKCVLNCKKACLNHQISQTLYTSSSKLFKSLRTSQGQFIRRPSETSLCRVSGIPFHCQRQFDSRNFSQAGTCLFKDLQNGSLVSVKPAYYSTVRGYCSGCWQERMLDTYRQRTVRIGSGVLIRRFLQTSQKKTDAATDSPGKVVIPTKKRTTRKKPQETEEPVLERNVAAFTVADELYLDKLEKYLREENSTYQVVKLPVDITGTLLLTPKEEYVINKARAIFLFEDGSAVCWNMSKLDRSAVFKFAQMYCETPYKLHVVEDQLEIMPVVTDTKSSLIANTVHIRGGDTNSTPETKLSIFLDKFAFSNAMAQSVRLSMEESRLDAAVERLEPKTQDLRDGKRINMSRKTRNALNRELGEIFLLRHNINLRSDLLDTPDAYWDRDALGELYQSMCKYLSIQKRTKVMNEKLNYCTQVLDLFSGQLNDERHVQLEKLIILLIMVEVVIEILHWFPPYKDWFPRYKEQRPLQVEEYSDIKEEECGKQSTEES